MSLPTLPGLDPKFLANRSKFEFDTSPKPNKLLLDFDWDIEVENALKSPVKPLNVDRAVELVASSLNLVM